MKKSTKAGKMPLMMFPGKCKEPKTFNFDTENFACACFETQWTQI